VYINQAGDSMKKKKPERTVFQAVMQHNRLEKLRKIADYRGQTMSAVFFGWIDGAWAKLPEDAK